MPTRVLYVLGAQHSGSTLLGNLLGERDGHVSVGELRRAWRQWLVPGAPCGCGAPVRECAFWREVGIEQAAGALGVAGAAALDARLESTRRLPALAGGRLDAQAAPLRAALARLHGRVAAVAGARVVVDTSKTPAAALLLEPVADLHVVHLVRDSRGVLASHRRRGTPGFPARTLLALWTTWNVHAERRYGAGARVRYEDLARGQEVTLGVHHTIEGNRGRFRTGTLPIEEDRRWRTELSRRDRALALALTGPLLVRHGYLPRASASTASVLDTIRSTP